jgi:hypothetical protein
MRIFSWSRAGSGSGSVVFAIVSPLRPSAVASGTNPDD